MARPFNSKPEAALHYASRGWHVLPLHSISDGQCTCGKSECHSAGKHPRTPHGLKDSTTDIEQIRLWWTEWPDSNIGIRTGQISGIVALDVDPRNGGADSFAALIAEYGQLPETLVADTGGGGQHYIFKYPGDEPLKAKKGFKPGLDLKSDGGYIVVEPSNHASGGTYRFRDLNSPLAETPTWLVNMANGPHHTPPPASPTIIAAAFGDGSRNDSLTRTGGFLRRLGLSAESLEGALLALNEALCSPPLGADEVRRIAESLSKYRNDELPLDRFTDLANAELFADMFCNSVKFCIEERQWYLWDGLRWRRDDKGQVLFKVKQTLVLLWELASQITDEKLKKSLHKHLDRSESERGLKAIVNLAAPHCAVSISDFDTDPYILGVENGYLDLKTGSLVEPAPTCMISKISMVVWDEVECPTWMAFLRQVLGGNAELISFMQRAVGYTLTGTTVEQSFFIVHGDGANGKSTFLEVLRLLMAEYGRQADFSSFVYRENRNNVRNDIARLAGSRFVSASESDRQQRLDEAVIKTLTGGDKISARFLHREFFEFVPTFKLWLATNHRPKIVGSDHGIWRRVHLVPFTVRIPSEAQDRHLIDKLKAELPGILRWAVAGCMTWQEQGLNPPQIVRAETARYRFEEDTLARFFDEECLFDKNLTVASHVLQDTYTDWCKRNSESPRRWNDVADALKAKGATQSRSSDTRSWVGVSLRRGASLALLASMPGQL